MIKVGITGSIASGKTSVSKIMSKKKWPVFSADNTVKKLYTNKFIKKKISKKFKFTTSANFKEKLKKNILKNKTNLKKLGKIIHPFVRKKMIDFFKKNKHKKYLFCEVPLLIENKLIKYFDVLILIKSKKSLRLKRYVSKGGEARFFELLNSFQLKDSKKAKYCDYTVVNNTSLLFLKKNVLNIIRRI
tara:strand:+ start:11980 stop:12543 length:564 start_codon:yes stop_codon:yes gene_type:complete